VWEYEQIGLFCNLFGHLGRGRKQTIPLSTAVLALPALIKKNL
jgi:hypothetical protein